MAQQVDHGEVAEKTRGVVAQVGVKVVANHVEDLEKRVDVVECDHGMARIELRSDLDFPPLVNRLVDLPVGDLGQ